MSFYVIRFLGGISIASSENYATLWEVRKNLIVSKVACCTFYFYDMFCKGCSAYFRTNKENRAGDVKLSSKSRLLFNTLANVGRTYASLFYTWD